MEIMETVEGRWRRRTERLSSGLVREVGAQWKLVGWGTAGRSES